jgi:RNA polymerase sigma-70 factor (ECF subfamily)
VQELFYQFWQKRENIQIETSIKSYLYKATRNSCFNSLKHKNIKNVYSESYKFENTEDFENDYNSIETNELSDKIRIAIDKLPSERKKIFLLVRFKNLKYKEVAAELKISIKTVENQMGSALKFLRSELKDFIPILIFVGIYIFQKYFKF